MTCTDDPLRIARVFPRRTQATPCDPLAFVGGPGLFPPEVDVVHVSVAFTYDRPKAESLAEEWRHVAPTEIGGPGMGMRGREFVPGMYLKPGYTITSRGCPNHCWFCSVWEREGGITEFPIRDGWNVLDDNILACSKEHVQSVFTMLRRQPNPIEFTGGLEAALLQDWHVDELTTLRLAQLFCAYDTPNDLEPLRVAGKMLTEAGITYANRKARAYVLCGFPNDTMMKAEGRMRETIMAGFMPIAMLWRDNSGSTDIEWRRFQRTWARPAIIAVRESR